MSKYRRVEVEFRSEEALRKALRYLQDSAGIVVEHAPEGAHLYGYMGDRRPEKAEYIIRRKYLGNASNDLGFARRADGTFEMIISDFDRNRHDKRIVNPLKQRYAYHAAVDQAHSMGYTISDAQVAEDGTIQIQLQRGY